MQWSELQKRQEVPADNVSPPRDEKLVTDPRSDMRPVEWVNQKLVSLLNDQAPSLPGYQADHGVVTG